MKPFIPLHSWDVTPKEAIAIQRNLKEHLTLRWTNPSVTLVGGADVSYPKGGKTSYAVVIVMTVPDFEMVDVAWICQRLSFPYIPGLLAFREVPALLEAWENLRHYPDLIYVDGQGIAHPRSMGLATHLGILLDVPSIGCAKTPLVGGEPVVGDAKGNHAPLIHRGEEVGVALRTRTGVKPLYVSPGHRIDLQTAMHWVLRACVKYRLPEPLRRAHIMANRLRTTAAS